MTNHLLILINNGDFTSIDNCINFIIHNKLDIQFDDFIKYVHVNFFDFINFNAIYDVIIMNQSNTNDFIINDIIINKFKITNISKHIKNCKLVENVDYKVTTESTTILYYLSHCLHSKKKYAFTPFAFKCILIYNNPEYVKYVLLLELCLHFHMQCKIL